MMKLGLKYLPTTFIFAMIAWANSAAAQDSIVSVENGYVRGLPPSVQNTSAYMTLVNTSDKMVMLVGASSSSASKVSIHQTEEANGMMNMAHMSMVSIAAHDEVKLESGGTHLMLMGLKSALVAGDEVEITLLFQSGKEQTVSLLVRSVLDE